jgi:hypothetical protein
MTNAQAVTAYTAHAAEHPMAHVNILTAPAAAAHPPPGTAARMGITAPIAAVGAAPARAVASAITSNTQSSRPIAGDYKLLISMAQHRTKWKSNSVAHEFMDMLETALRQSPLEPTCWIYLLPLMIPETDLNMQTWIEINITSPNLSWNAARNTFITHYERADWLDTQRARYEDCTQRSSESVQHYTDRFAALMHRLGIADDDESNIHHYMNGLHRDIHTKLFEHRSAMRNLPLVAAGATWDFDSFQTLSGKAISYETELALRDQQRSKHTPRHDTSTSVSTHRATSGHKRKSTNNYTEQKSLNKRGKSELHCKYHPDSKSHATKDCRNGGATSVSFSPRISVSPHTTRITPPLKDESELTCYGCGKPGHIRPNCPDRDKSDARGYSKNAPRGKQLKARKASVKWDQTVDASKRK